MRSIVCQLMAWLLLCGVAQAQNLLSGSEISGFRVPIYEEGVLRAQLFGEKARVLRDGDVEITHLKIEMFRDGEVAMTLYAPQCIYNREQSRAHSEGRVLIESGFMTIVGRGFVWSAEAGRFEIFEQAKVLVMEQAQAELKELER